MRYLVKQKVLSISDKFTIKDEMENDRFQVIGKVFSLGNKLTIQDMAGRELVYIEQKLLKFLPEYNLFMNGVNVAKVKKKLTFLKANFEIESSFGNFSMKGNVMAHEFSILKQGQEVATVSKKWISLSDTYTIDILDPENEVFLLALVIVIDQVLYDNN